MNKSPRAHKYFLSSHSYNKTPLTAWLINERLIVYTSGGWQGWIWRQPTSCCVLSRQKEGWGLSGLFPALIPLLRAPTSWPNFLPEAPTSGYHFIRACGRLQTWSPWCQSSTPEYHRYGWCVQMGMPVAASCSHDRNSIFRQDTSI